MTIRNVWFAAVLVTAAATLLAVRAGIASAQVELVESNVENGAVVDAPPEVFKLCFSEPVNNQDLADYVPEDQGDVPWDFSVRLPDGQGLGLRIVFEADGDCVEVFPGVPEDAAEGVWTFDWMVRSQETNEPLSDTIVFRVGPGDPPVVENGDDGDGSSDDTAIIVGVAVAVGVGAVAVVAGAVVLARRRRDAGGPE